MIEIILPYLILLILIINFININNILDWLKNNLRTTNPINTEVSANDNYKYKTNHDKRGHAIIFNHLEFNSISKRYNHENDCENIEEVLKALKFDVEVYNDFEYKQICDVLREVGAMDHSESDCLVVVVMSFGGDGVIHARDQPYPPDILWTSFNDENCPTLKGKPKLFILQACRTEDEKNDNASKNKYKIPSMTDSLIVFSTYPGHLLLQSQKSWFIEYLCEELRTRGKKEDILQILTIVNRRVTISYEKLIIKNKNEEKLIGMIFSTLTKQLTFK